MRRLGAALEACSPSLWRRSGPAWLTGQLSLMEIHKDLVGSDGLITTSGSGEMPGMVESRFAL